MGRDHPPTPQQTALRAIANVLVSRLRVAERETHEAPLIIQLDGSGHSEMLDELETCLRRGGSEDEPNWTVVRFDAWQHQRLAPPWWWLVSALDRQIRSDTRPDGWRRLLPYLWSRLRDATWRLTVLLKDFRVVVPFAIVAVLLWILAGPAMDDVLTSAAALATAVATLALATVSAMKPLRRRLLLSAPQPDTAVLRSSDPMADLRGRYGFLLRTVGTPVLVLIDNLDRCQADYVVELLEGLQTLLRHTGTANEKLPFVAFVVAADRDWLCHSFVRKYQDFESTARQPGRPFGQAFLEKVFDLDLRLPTIPAALSISDRQGEALSDIERNAVQACERAVSELEIREIVWTAEAEASTPVLDGLAPRPLQAVRIAAVTRLGKLELESRASVCPASTQYQCRDTVQILDELVAGLDAGASMISRLDTAYCVQRTTQLLGGHAIEAERSAIRRLGLWTILAATWPLLATHLVTHPEDVECLRDRTDPSTEDGGLRAVFRERAARQLGAGSAGDRLEKRDIERYSRPIGAEEPIWDDDPSPAEDTTALLRPVAG